MCEEFFEPPCVLLMSDHARRAKVKPQAKMRARAVEILEPPPLEPPPLTSGFDAEVFHLIHEDEGPF